MRCLAALSTRSAVRQPKSAHITSINFNGVEAKVGFIQRDDLTFDAEDPKNTNNVFIRVRSFSCNYREKSRILKSTIAADGFFVLGSEFVGEIIAVGIGVKNISLGDRVIGNGNVDLGSTHPGLTTQTASNELQILSQDKVIVINDTMSDDVAASFSIGAQTAYSMVNRLPCKEGEHILVTAASSNTSLFALRGLQLRKVTVHALTTNSSMLDYLNKIGVENVCLIDRKQDFSTQMSNYLSERGLKYFDHVVDPFMDVYLRKLVSFTRRFGSYITCGVAQQSTVTELDDFANQGLPIHEVFSLILRKSISLMGNNLGVSADLKHAIDDYHRGLLHVDIDAAFEGTNSTLEFIQRSFLHAQRQGKVVYRYTN